MKHRYTILPVIALVFALLLFVWFSIPVFSGVLNLGNALGMLFAVGIGGVTLGILSLKRQRKERGAMILLIIGGILGSLILIWAGITTAFMISGAVPKKHDENATVIVLGCKVKGEEPGLHLSRRIEAASRYLKEHPDANCVASGGKGSGERISEAQAIFNKLTADGIDPSRIVLEEQSVNTEQNLRFSLAKIRKHGWSEELVLITDGFHQYRAAFQAKKLGLIVSPVSARHVWHTFPANYGRELIAITKTWVLG